VSIASLTHLARGSEEEANHGERDVVWRVRQDDAENEHGVLAGEVDRLATESIRHRRKDDGANHDAEAEHGLSRLHQIVLVAYQVPLPSREHQYRYLPTQVCIRCPKLK